jgi:hypothetical protein
MRSSDREGWSPAIAALARALAIAALLLALAAPARALANAAQKSSNWGGYAVHGRGLSFHTVVGGWREPRVSCVLGAVNSSSAFWIGLGGVSSHALEQVGTGVDCGPFGNQVDYAWYEMVPRPPVILTWNALRVRPGDMMSAGVVVDGGRVTVSLYNATRQTGFSKVLHATTVDASTAEWIVEAPSVCPLGRCFSLPLANFHSLTFRFARAQSRAGHLGSISDPSWRSTRINLLEHGMVYGAGTARPSSLRSGGSSFTVTYSRRSAAAKPGARFAASTIRIGSGL